MVLFMVLFFSFQPLQYYIIIVYETDTVIIPALLKVCNIHIRPAHETLHLPTTIILSYMLSKVETYPLKTNIRSF